MAAKTAEKLELEETGGDGPVAVTPGGVHVVETGLTDPRELIIDEGANGRRYPAGITEMVRSLLDNGQEQPIKVRRKDGRLHVVFGFRRARAALQIVEQGLMNEFALRYELVDMTDTEAYLHNLIENAGREDTSAIDDGHNYTRLKQPPYNMSQRHIARLLGVSDALVSRKISLTTLSPKLQKLIHMGRVPVEHGYELVAMTEEQREAYLEQLLGGGKVTASDVRQKKTEAARKKGVKDDDNQPARVLSGKAIRLPFEEVVTKWPEDKEPTPYIRLCDVITKLCRGQLAAKSALRKLKEIVGE